MQEALSNVPHADGHGQFVRPAIEPRRPALRFEATVAGFAMLGLVAAEMMVSNAIHGTHFAGGDGKIAQAIIMAAYEFADFFSFNNISPVEGVGSQSLPMNVWISPAYWPFAIMGKTSAATASGMIALGIFATASYLMARCFDVPMVPSIIAAQMTIVLFGPFTYLFQWSTVFSLMVGNAVVYAPYMVALGLLARVEPGSWHRVVLITSGIFVLLLYSICCDPLWSAVCASIWALPFAIVALSPMQLKPMMIRCAALACCIVLFAVIGVAEYYATLTLATARVQYSALGDRARLPDLMASAIFYSPYMKYFYFAWLPGWLLGLWTLRGRARVLVTAGIASCAGLIAAVLIYLLLQDAPWSFPLPVYAEQSLFALFLVSAVAGYWGALQAAAHRVMQPSSWAWWAKAPAALGALAVIPASVAVFSVTRPAYMSDRWNEPRPPEPELAQLFVDNIAVAAGKPFRGSLLFGNVDYLIIVTVAHLWARGVPTISEVSSQLVTPQSLYFSNAVLKNDVRGALNFFWPYPRGSLNDFLIKMQMLGLRYWVVPSACNPAKGCEDWGLQSSRFTSIAVETGYPLLKRPTVYPEHFDQWLILELPHPNVGDYTPTEIVVAKTAMAIAQQMSLPDFDPARKVLLISSIDEPLVPARDMRMSLVRGGLHISGHSGSTSLVVLPQQFSHCLRARDDRVRLVRANLMMTGVIFSGDIDTDIMFDYGLFTPRCRWADISDIEKLKMQIDARAVPLSGEGLFPSWEESVAKLRAAASAIK